MRPHPESVNQVGDGPDMRPSHMPTDEGREEDGIDDNDDDCGEERSLLGGSKRPRPAQPAVDNPEGAGPSSSEQSLGKRLTWVIANNLDALTRKLETLPGNVAKALPSALEEHAVNVWARTEAERGRASVEARIEACTSVAELTLS